MEHIFLLGHRKTAGKDVSCKIMADLFTKNSVSYTHTFFAKMLKKHVCERYGLDFDRMGDDDYKNSKPDHLCGLTVREVLIKEGCFARSIWQNTWSFPVYSDLLQSDCKVGIVSDFRYPNEYSCFEECFNIVSQRVSITKPKVYKVLIHRPAGKFVNDGADDQLPDVCDYWDYTIMNDDVTNAWRQNIENQLRNMIKFTVGI
jgi:hypothetical protein